MPEIEGIEKIEEISGFAPIWDGTVSGEYVIAKIDSSEMVEVCGKDTLVYNLILLRPAKITKYEPNKQSFVKEFPVNTLLRTNAHGILIGKLKQVMLNSPIMIEALGDRSTKAKNGQNAPYDYKVTLVKIK